MIEWIKEMIRVHKIHIPCNVHQCIKCSKSPLVVFVIHELPHTNTHSHRHGHSTGMAHTHTHTERSVRISVVHKMEDTFLSKAGEKLLDIQTKHKNGTETNGRKSFDGTSPHNNK